MKVLKVMKRSIKFLCEKCRYPATVKKGSQCHISGKCGNCMATSVGNPRMERLNWRKWWRTEKRKWEGAVKVLRKGRIL